MAEQVVRQRERAQAGLVLASLEREGALEQERVGRGLGDLGGRELAVVGCELAELACEGGEGGGVGGGLGEALVGEVLGRGGVFGRGDGRLEMLGLSPGALGVEEDDEE